MIQGIKADPYDCIQFQQTDAADLYKPEQFLADICNREWLEMKWINDWAKGTPYVDSSAGGNERILPIVKH